MITLSKRQCLISFHTKPIKLRDDVYLFIQVFMLPGLLDYMDILIAENEVINMSRRLPCRINVHLDPNR